MDCRCDTANGDFCPDEVVVTGAGFICDKRCNECKFDLPEGEEDIVVEGVFVGEDAILCPVPKGSGPGR